MSQLLRLAKPFSPRFISQLPGKGQADYVSHAVVTEALLAIVGPFSYEVKEVIRDKDGDVSGCLGTLNVNVDGEWVTITEVGDTSGQEKNDGERLKNASSDAIKRCAMRIGLGLHLWAQDAYVLYDQLTKSEGGAVSSDAAVSAVTEQSSASGTAATSECPECGRDEDAHAPVCSRRPM